MWIVHLYQHDEQKVQQAEGPCQVQHTLACTLVLQLYIWSCQHDILVQQALSLPGVTTGPSPTDKRRALHSRDNRLPWIFSDNIYLYTHTYIHTYVYIYMYVWGFKPCTPRKSIHTSALLSRMDRPLSPASRANRAWQLRRAGWLNYVGPCEAAKGTVHWYILVMF